MNPFSINNYQTVIGGMNRIPDLLINTKLFTKDGRVVGNAIITGVEERTYDSRTIRCYSITTDYGNNLKMYEDELRNRFYIGDIADDTHKHYK